MQPIIDTNSAYFQPADAYCLEIKGSDAVTVANNLTTNDFTRLGTGSCLETFVTNVRGWVVAHGIAAQLPDRIWLLGQHSSPQFIRDHFERYIIREDATVQLRTDLDVLFVADPDRKWLGEHVPAATKRHSIQEFELANLTTWIAAMPISGCEAALIYAKSGQDVLLASLAKTGLSRGVRQALELLRVSHHWPLEGREIGEKTIPQELDRDQPAISFTKGCYLGQETIARLDARGQLQKKLCLVEAKLDQSVVPEPGCSLFMDDREVGQLTSIANQEHRLFGLAWLKRGSFEAGTNLTVETHQQEPTAATVVEPSYE